MSTTFSKLGVPQWVSEALARQGITEPFQIQKITIKEGLDGDDICGRAPTGSGKTLAFGIPLVVRTKAAKPRKPQSLILAPTRELADQICKELRAFSGKRIVSVVYGGVSYGPQRKALTKGVDILVACPGRLEDLIEQRELTLEDVKQVVIDEADRMADMGFMPAVKRILDQTSKERQTILFSATLDHDVAKLKKHYQRNPVTREIGEKTPDIKNADHTYAIAKKAEKPELVAKAVNSTWPAIIFCRTRHGADRLVKQLKRLDIDSEPIHGGKSQHQRKRALKNFSTGKVQALVATDVAARGIHVDGVALVVHYDPPEDHKAYIHRSGRTARAGSQGVVLSIIQPEQKKNAKKLQKRLGITESIREINADQLPEIQSQPQKETQQKTRHEHKRANESRTTSKPKGKKPANRNSKGSAKKRPQNKKHKPRKSNASQQKRKSNKNNHQKSQQNQAKRSNNGSQKSQPNRKARRAHLQHKK
ncbi:MAG: RNA helicase [Euryarchaeota archaeon]|nr:RNA helicase [Euryarchaeota archaeon]